MGAPHGAWRDALLMEHVVGAVRSTLKVLEAERLLWCTFEDLLRFNGHGSPDGAALAFKARAMRSSSCCGR